MEPKGSEERCRAPFYPVEGCFIAYSLQADSDLHVLLRGKSTATMIVGFPDPEQCAPFSHAPEPPMTEHEVRAL